MDKKHLLIGGSGIPAKSIPAGFEKIGDDYTSLWEANERRPLDTYYCVVFWPTETAFDFAKGPEVFANRTKKIFPDQRILPLELSALHTAKDSRLASWDGPSLEHLLWEKLESECYLLLQPLVRRVLRNGPPVFISAAQPKCSPRIPLYGWFCPQLEETTTCPVTRLNPCKAEHRLEMFFNTLIECFDETSMAFSVKQRFYNDEFPLDCLGRSLSIPALDPTRDFATKDEFLDFSSKQEAYAGAFTIRGIHVDATGYVRAVALTNEQSGILVHQRPHKVDRYLKTVSSLIQSGGASQNASASSSDEYVTVEQAAELAGKSKKTIYNWARSNDESGKPMLPNTKGLGTRNTRILKADLTPWCRPEQVDI